MKHILLFAFALLISACTPSGQHSVYWVNSYQVDCSGIGPMKCLLVQKNETLVDSAWQTFYAPIEGFEFEPGFLYKISVTEEKLDSSEVPADGSSIRYTLVKILDKSPDPKMLLNDIWILTTMGGKTINPAKEGEGRKDVQMEFKLSERRVNGSDGCNNFSGSIKTLGAETLQLGPLASTRKMCMDMTLTDHFNMAIQKVNAYSIQEGQLTLYDKYQTELMTLKKID